ncbi:MAG: energy transducer TonB [Thermoanaerobaculia bacterium]
MREVEKQFFHGAPTPERNQNITEGTVVVRYTIDTRGRVREVTILRRSRSPLFDESAVHAIRNWRFKPLKRDGQFVEVVHDLTIYFVLEQES